jgi:hypothetical protein
LIYKYGISHLWPGSWEAMRLEGLRIFLMLGFVEARRLGGSRM